MKQIKTTELSKMKIGNTYYIRSSLYCNWDIGKAQLLKIEEDKAGTSYTFESSANLIEQIDSKKESHYRFFEECKSYIYSMASCVDGIGTSITINGEDIPYEFAKRIQESITEEKDDDFIDGYVECLSFIMQ